MNELKVYYTVVTEKYLTMSESFLLCYLYQFGINNKIPSNKKISNYLNINEKSISYLLKRLIKKEYIKKLSNYTYKEVFDILSKGYSHENGCIICGYSKSTLDEHHYPVRAKNGGNETISICANCHREFHEIADYNRHLKFTEKAERLFA